MCQEFVLKERKKGGHSQENRTNCCGISTSPEDLVGCFSSSPVLGKNSRERLLNGERIKEWKMLMWVRFCVFLIFSWKVCLEREHKETEETGTIAAAPHRVPSDCLYLHLRVFPQTNYVPGVDNQSKSLRDVHPPSTLVGSIRGER